MSEFTDLILSKKPDDVKSERQYLMKIGIDPQKFNGWKNGAMPDDKTISKISEELGIDFLLLYSMAKASGRGGRGFSVKSLTDWKKVLNHRKEELSRREREIRLNFAGNITGSLD